MVPATVHIDDDRGVWHGSTDTYVSGHAFHDGVLYRSPELLDLVAGTPIDDLDELVSDLNGFFSIARRTPESAYLAVDHVRTYPLFYAVVDDRAYVSNDAHWITAQLPNPRADSLLEFEFLLTGVVTGSDTLVDDVKQVEAGGSVVVDGTGDGVTVTTSRHTRFQHRPPLEATEDELLAGFDAVVERSVRRLIEVADGRQLAVSLSGGPDCRLIACMLRRLDYDDLVAFTFGREGNWDSATAVDVARALDIPIEVVTYDFDTWHDWFHSDERVDYYRYAFNYDVLPSIGAVPAMGELARSGSLDDDAIVLCGNLVPSRHDYPRTFQRAAPATAGELAEYMVGKYYKYWDWDDDEAAAAFRSRIESQLELDPTGGEPAVVAAFKDWRMRNRNAKLYVVPEEYAFWGFDAWTPLWDLEFVRFWERVPIRFREEKRLHRTYVERLFREVAGEAAAVDDSMPAGPLRRLESVVYHSPLEGLVRPVYDRLEDVYKDLTRSPTYHRHPVGTLGFMPEDQYEVLAKSRDQGIHPFKALELLGCVSFDPPRVIAGPTDGVLDRERLATDERVAYRNGLPWFDTGAEEPAYTVRAADRSR